MYFIYALFLPDVCIFNFFSIVTVKVFVASFLQREWRAANLFDPNSFRFFVVHIALFVGIALIPIS